MKTFSKKQLGKAVKKWIMNGRSYEEISRILNTPINECIDAYFEYMHYDVQPKAFHELEKLILNGEKIHVYGNNGVGKTHIVKSIARKNNFGLVVSYPFNESELLKDFGDKPFQKSKNNTLFLIEGDFYYWKKYSLVKKYIEDSIHPIVIITTQNNTPTKHITKLLKSVKILPPSRLDVANWLKEIGEENDEQLLGEIYDKDWRKIKLNYQLRKRNTFKREVVEKLDSKIVAYRILKGIATIDDINNCIHPFFFINNWIGWNAHKFYGNKKLMKVMEIVSFIDANKKVIKGGFLKRMLLEIPPSTMKDVMDFPPFKRKTGEEELPREAGEFIKTKKGKKRKKRKLEQSNIGDFLLI